MLTVIPNGASSWDMERVQPRWAPLAATYGLKLGTPRSKTSEPMLMMRPCLRAFIPGRTARVTR